MLAIARRRTGGRLPAVVADAFHLPCADASFDGATVGFGLRHSQQDLPVLLRELRRVLRPGARLVVLELSHPPSPTWRWLTGLYMHSVVPMAGAVVDAEAYRYLSESLHGYPDAPALRQTLLECGFAMCTYYLLSGGIVAVHVAEA
jgi:demethylmenaquinone methyltransferase/2-methoxy-6-polyprenyl-1,4-benzoquinol methylase